MAVRYIGQRNSSSAFRVATTCWNSALGVGKGSSNSKYKTGRVTANPVSTDQTATRAEIAARGRKGTDLVAREGLIFTSH